MSANIAFSEELLDVEHVPPAIIKCGDGVVAWCLLSASKFMTVEYVCPDCKKPANECKANNA